MSSVLDLAGIDREPGETIPECLKRIAIEENNKIAGNMALFFTELGKNFGQLPRQKFFPNRDKVWKQNMLYNIGEKHWDCHITAPYLAMHHIDVKCQYGFCDDIVNEIYQTTVCHSFLTDARGLHIYDPQYEYQFEHQPQIQLRARNYYGVYIPTSLATEIYLSAGEGISENLSGYLKRHIFSSKGATLNFIYKIKKLQEKGK